MFSFSVPCISIHFCPIPNYWRIVLHLLKTELPTSSVLLTDFASLFLLTETSNSSSALPFPLATNVLASWKISLSYISFSLFPFSEQLFKNCLCLLPPYLIFTFHFLTVWATSPFPHSTEKPFFIPKLPMMPMLLRRRLPFWSNFICLSSVVSEVGHPFLKYYTVLASRTLLSAALSLTVLTSPSQVFICFLDDPRAWSQTLYTSLNSLFLINDLI